MKTLIPTSILFLSACAGLHPRYHEVAAGEHLSSLAKRYQVSISDLIQSNGLKKDQVPAPGTKIYIPFETRPDWNADFLPNRRVASIPDRAKIETQATVFNWPIRGRISSYFGNRRLGRHRPKHHDGIDIAAHRGTPVDAARAGHVIYASNRIPGYGNMVILRHVDSLSSVYAHLSKIKVKKGDFVSRGFVLGTVGNTGHSTAPHLHFEIRNDQTPVDPLQFLKQHIAANEPQRRVKLR
jgi:murein DD-endopeptidase MepM/ murein hydrolase activator NlpD